MIEDARECLRALGYPSAVGRKMLGQGMVTDYDDALGFIDKVQDCGDALSFLEDFDEVELLIRWMRLMQIGIDAFEAGGMAGLISTVDPVELTELYDEVWDLFFLSPDDWQFGTPDFTDYDEALAMTQHCIAYIEEGKWHVRLGIMCRECAKRFQCAPHDEEVK